MASTHAEPVTAPAPELPLGPPDRRPAPASPVARLRSLVAPLYPVVRPPARPGVGAAVAAVAALTSLLRSSPAELDRLWAEDGRVFLQQMLTASPLDALTTPYAGYLHVFPRLAAEVAGWAPLSLAGVVLSVAAAAVVGLTAWAVWVLGAAHLPSPWLRGGLTAGVALLPAGGLEAINNVANSHFYLIAASFWALLACRPGALRQVVPSLVVALAALSDPVAGGLLPLAVGRLIAVRSWRDRTVALVYLVALGGQLAVVASAERPLAEMPPADDVAYGYALRVVSTSILGLGGTRRLLVVGGHWAVAALAGVVLLVLVLAWLWARRRLLLVAATGLASVAFFVAACAFASGSRFPPTGAVTNELLAGSRYSLVPTLLLMTAAALVAQGVTERLPATGARRAVTAAVLVPLAVFAVVDYRAMTALDLGMEPWSEQVAAAAAGCRGAEDDVRVFPIAPGPAWVVQIPCRLLVP